ncbi:MAG TPA: protein-methionine-sulfoxide reductase heme-binding subunit MsrQ [Burkholderiaceae bacterium]|nr:protein-methionine-sulfoxide reductase heme-binding subunit MsrQ [Burkholderiaceae bacterium]
MSNVSRALAQAIVQHRATKPALFVLALLPMTWLVVGVVNHALGPNPAETLIRSLGDWTLRFLCLTLAVTPLRQWTGVAALARLRRMLGLFTAFYAALHFSSYAVFDMGLVWSDIVRDVAKRPFILVGTAAFLLLLPLAATSFNRAIKWLGAARWQQLHRIVYAIAMLAMLHFFWMRAGKRNFGEVAVYGAIVAVLLGWRLLKATRGTRYFMKLGSHSAKG